MVEQVDVVVAGGGMVGATLACALGEAGLRVALVEQREPSGGWPPEEVDLRVSALTRASQRIFSHLGAWERMVALRVSPYRQMRVWDADGGGIGFAAAEIGEADLGHIVENRVVQWALWERLRELATVTLWTPQRVAHFVHDPLRGMVVTLSGGEVLEAALLVAAEGASSPVRESAGITSSGWAYDQSAVVATITLEGAHGDTAYQRFMPSGPLALLPINDGRCSIVWSTSPLAAKRLVELEERAFCQELTVASQRLLGRVLGVGPRACFPLRLRNADRYVLPGLALVGDAAHGLHPLAGQGVNLGLLDAVALVDVLLEAREQGRGMGSLATLRRYERARKGDDLAMLMLMDLFTRTFSNHNPLLRVVRNLGLEVADRAGPLKHLVMRRALGLEGRLPRLAR